jgi:hypothetical protein
MVLGDMLLLGCLHQLEPFAVTVEHLKAMPHLCRPEIEVGDMTGKLVPVQRNEPTDLIGDQFCYVS